jgi:vanillate O-demethylase ferredoxin subunit
MAEIELKVSLVKDLTPNIKMFEFVAANGGDLPPFQAGAHIDVKTAHGLRSYSLANHPKERHRYVTAVLREHAGQGGSRWMHEQLKPNITVTSSEPIQNFPLVESAKKSLLLGGGIGITPLLAMCYRLKEIGADFHLHYCTRSPEDTAFLAEVGALVGDRVTFYYDGGDPSKGIKLKDVFGTPPDGAHLYVCGPGGLLNATRDATAHWPQGTVHFELFASAKTAEQRAALEARTNEEFEVELAQSGVTLTIPADRSILDVLLDIGFGVPYACEDGWCGACTIGVISGKPDHRDEFLSDADKAEGKKMQVCISRAMPGEKLVLDL